MTVNTDKTKIVVFRKGGKVKDNETWTYNGINISVVDQFCYLGFLLKFNNKFNFMSKHLAEQGRKALFALRSKCNNLNLNIKTMLHLFDTYISSILCYACEVWSTHNALEVEKVHLEFCKILLGVKKSTCNAMIYIELGRLPLKNMQLNRMLKFWFKLLNSDNCILREAYNLLYMEIEKENPKQNWLLHVKHKLFELGFGYIWLRQLPSDFVYMPIIKERINDQASQTLFNSLHMSSKCDLYKHMVNKVTLQFYLTKSLPSQLRKMITKLRLSAHNLAIESGRYRNIPRCHRYCINCNSWKKPSVFKVIELLNTNSLKELNLLGRFIKEAFSCRIV
ncbi:uncharacterized protein LOC117321133 [Pecten maximus]|uniref:uncharacterized protein LOC117321133 n=1 Tax=Pecten maximus TaxID=6579 RepID=UPI0014589AAC|nr:uncharacterized protein LOC117321133 [Pecten maximus]